MSKIWFSSDPHYFHANVIKYCSRPYLTVDDMNLDLIRKWNEKVKPEDTVYLLGDFSLAFRPVEIFSQLLNGTKYLVPGNHDFCHTYNKKSRNPENHAKWVQKYKDHGWIVLPELTTLDVPGMATFNLCHHPYSDLDARDTEGKPFHDKYAKWRPKDDGRILLCGHIHEKWKVKLSKSETPMCNVGVDVWDGYPVDLDQIMEAIIEYHRTSLQFVPNE